MIDAVGGFCAGHAQRRPAHEAGCHAQTHGLLGEALLLLVLGGRRELGAEGCAKAGLGEGGRFLLIADLGAPLLLRVGAEGQHHN